MYSGSYLDLRFLALHTSNVQHGGLASLVRQLLNRKLDKDWRIRASNWEIDELNQKQKIYAADDSLSALQILARFYQIHHLDYLNELIQRHLNQDFKFKQPKQPSKKR